MKYYFLPLKKFRPSGEVWCSLNFLKVSKETIPQLLNHEQVPQFRNSKVTKKQKEKKKRTSPTISRWNKNRWPPNKWLQIVGLFSIQNITFFLKDRENIKTVTFYRDKIISTLCNHSHGFHGLAMHFAMTYYRTISS